MIRRTFYTITGELLSWAQREVKQFDGKTSINQPTGDFFYDPWAVKPEYYDSVWAYLLQSLPHSIGEARIIKLEENECYSSHADIDDRWHLNLTGVKSYLIDLENKHMYPQTQDGTWWDMNAGLIHSAVNFGNTPRYQLVVRQLLTRNQLMDPVNVNVQVVNRYAFDEVFSPWLNEANKEGKITDFFYRDTTVYFTVERSCLTQLMSMATDNLIVQLS